MFHKSLKFLFLALFSLILCSVASKDAEERRYRLFKRRANSVGKYEDLSAESRVFMNVWSLKGNVKTTTSSGTSTAPAPITPPGTDPPPGTGTEPPTGTVPPPTGTITPPPPPPTDTSPPPTPTPAPPPEPPPPEPPTPPEPPPGEPPTSIAPPPASRAYNEECHDNDDCHEENEVDNDSVLSAFDDNDDNIHDFGNNNHPEKLNDTYKIRETFEELRGERRRLQRQIILLRRNQEHHQRVGRRRAKQLRQALIKYRKLQTKTERFERRSLRKILPKNIRSTISSRPFDANPNLRRKHYGKARDKRQKKDQYQKQKRRKLKKLLKV